MFIFAYIIGFSANILHFELLIHQNVTSLFCTPNVTSLTFTPNIVIVYDVIVLLLLSWWRRKPKCIGKFILEFVFFWTRFIKVIFMKYVGDVFWLAARHHCLLNSNTASNTRNFCTNTVLSNSDFILSSHLLLYFNKTPICSSCMVNTNSQPLNNNMLICRIKFNLWLICISLSNMFSSLMK